MTDLIVHECSHAMAHAMGHAHTRDRGSVMVQDEEAHLEHLDSVEERRVHHCCLHRSIEYHHGHVTI